MAPRLKRNRWADTEETMKREISFFKDKRGKSGKSLLALMRHVGMSDEEIKAALKEKSAQPALAGDGATAADESISADGPAPEA